MLLKTGLAFAIFSVVSGVLSLTFRLVVIRSSVNNNPGEVIHRPKVSLWWISVIYGLNALSVLLTLVSLATGLCNGEQCNEEYYECLFDNPVEDIEYCVEKCKPGSGVALAGIAAFFWLLSCFGTLSSLQEEGVHQKDCVEHHGNSFELDADAKRPLLS